jgi:hypothetical protein
MVFSSTMSISGFMKIRYLGQTLVVEADTQTLHVNHIFHCEQGK